MLIIFIIGLYIVFDMSFKFIVGLGLGLYIGTKYNLNPLLKYTEDEINSRMLEFKLKIDKYKK